MGLAGELEAVGIGEGHAEQLSLCALVAALVGVAVSRARVAGVGRQAGGAVAGDAHGAKAAADVGGDGDAVAFFDAGDSGADLLDNAQGFVADDAALDPAHASLVEVEVGAADRGRSDAEEDVGLGPHLGVGDFLDGDPASFFKDDGFHGELLFGFGCVAGYFSRTEVP